jgi:hypothetical protein
MGIIETLLCKIFPFTDIKRSGTDDLYLRRWFIYPRDKDFGKNKGKGRLYLHKFYRGDEDEHLHCHPWRFTSLIITRGYWEEVSFYSERISTDKSVNISLVQRHREEPELRRVTFYPRFSIIRRPATWQHRVILEGTTPVWTIVKTGVKERSWGFWIKGKLCPWRNYRDGVCWCESEENGPQKM